MFKEICTELQLGSLFSVKEISRLLATGVMGHVVYNFCQETRVQAMVSTLIPLLSLTL